MKAIFIDAEKRKVEDIEINFAGTCGLDEFYAKIGHGCDMVEAVYFDGDNDKDLLCVDEEGTFRNLDSGFIIGGTLKIVGNGIIVGAGSEDFTDTTLTAAQIAPKVKFRTIEELAEINGEA